MTLKMDISHAHVNQKDPQHLSLELSLRIFNKSVSRKRDNLRDTMRKKGKF